MHVVLGLVDDLRVDCLVLIDDGQNSPFPNKNAFF